MLLQAALLLSERCMRFGDWAVAQIRVLVSECFARSRRHFSAAHKHSLLFGVFAGALFQKCWCRYDKQTRTHTLYAIDTRLIQYVPGGGARRSQHLAGTKATAGGGAVDQSVVVTRSSGPPGEKKRFVVIMSHNLGLMVFLRNMIYRFVI